MMFQKLRGSTGHSYVVRRWMTSIVVDERAIVNEWTNEGREEKTWLKLVVGSALCCLQRWGQLSVSCRKKSSKLQTKYLEKIGWVSIKASTKNIYKREEGQIRICKSDINQTTLEMMKVCFVWLLWPEIPSGNFEQLWADDHNPTLPSNINNNIADSSYSSYSSLLIPVQYPYSKSL